tara:strand:- start:344 stop:598 length:255 start_codon:yes stop_codon:yes gene_type:complete
MKEKELPRPRVYQISIQGKRNGAVAWVKEILLVINEYDLKNSIEVLSEDLDEVDSVKTTEIEVGYSPLFHDIIIGGCNYVGINS